MPMCNNVPPRDEYDEERELAEYRAAEARNASELELTERWAYVEMKRRDKAQAEGDRIGRRWQVKNIMGGRRGESVLDSE